jgi:glycosyltransferase involved in cell wall biosynthesis
MKIGVVSNTAWNIYNFRMPLIEALIGCGHDIYAIAPVDDYANKIKSANCRFIPLKHLSRQGSNPFRDLKLKKELQKIYAVNQLDIVCSFTIKPNIYGSLAATKTGAKSICTVTGLGYTFLNRSFTAFIARRLYKFAFNKADLVVFQNQDDLDLFANKKLVATQKTTIVPGSGVDTNHFVPIPGQLKKAPFKFLFIGRLLYDKGVVELLDAAYKLSKEDSNFELMLVGSFDMGNPAVISETQLNNYLSKCSNIIYKGTSDDVRGELSHSHCLVLPSYREGLPRVILEAMSMQIPIITTDVPGCKDTVLDGYNGFVVAAKDADALYLSMKRMMNLDSSERQRMGLNGRQLVLDTFDQRLIAQHYLNLIESNVNINT